MLYSVQFLRFLAAAIVVVSHSFLVIGIPKTVTIGDVGVDVFFVISGLVIGLSTKETDSARDFALKRFVRVVPPYWIATLAMISLLFYVGKPPSADDVWHSFLFIAKFETGWFPIVFPGWTLSYEMLFYSAFGLLHAVARRQAGILCAILFAALSAVWITRSSGYTINTDLYLEFVFGLAISEWLKRIPGRSPWLGLIAISAALVVLFINRHGPGGSLRWGLPSFCLVAGMIQLEGLSVWRSRICRVLGDASYSIYLFHIVLMLVVQQCANRLGISLIKTPLESAVVLICLAIAGGVVLDLILIGPLTNWLRRTLISPRKPSGRAPAAATVGSG